MKAEQILSIKMWEKDLPALNKMDFAYVVGHRVALEAIWKGDGSWECELISRLIRQFAWRLAYCRYVDEAIKSGEQVKGYEKWKKSE
jgi:hypothetical protein